MKKYECVISNIRLISVNKKYKNHPSYSQCKEYLMGLFQLFNVHNIKFTSPVHVLLFLSTNQDIDNNLKVIFDALEMAGILENDNLIRGLSVNFSDHVPHAVGKDSFKIIIKDKTHG